MTIVEQARIKLEARIDYSKIKPLHWICGKVAEDHDVDASQDYCPDCAREVASEIIRKAGLNTTVDDCVDGGWCTQEDGYTICHRCGCLLNVSYVAADDDEMNHFEQYGVTNERDEYSLYLCISAEPDNPRLEAICRKWIEGA